MPVSHLTVFTVCVFFLMTSQQCQSTEDTFGYNCNYFYINVN